MIRVAVDMAAKLINVTYWHNYQGGSPVRSLDLKIIPPDEGGEFLIVEMIGFLDADTVQIFNQRVREHLTDNVQRLILNLKDLVYISSAGIGSMMGWAQWMRENNNGRLILAQPLPKVYKILDLLGFTRVVEIVDSLDSAFIPTQK